MHKLMLSAAAISAAVIPAAVSGRTAAVATPDATGPAAVTFTVTGTYSDGTSRMFEVDTSSPDAIDGAPVSGFLRVTCTSGAVASAAFAPRDSASGLATGKRMHKPITVTKQMDAVSAAVGKTGSWNLKEGKGARASAGGPEGVDDWQQVNLLAVPADLCS
jgi:hypothetical protein